MEKADTTNAHLQTINKSHNHKTTNDRLPVSYTQQACNTSYRVSTAITQAISCITTSTKRVKFARKIETIISDTVDNAHNVHVTYASGADRHYLREDNRKKAGLQILHKSTKIVQVVNRDTSKAVHATKLPFPQLSPQASQADTFKQFPTSLMSVGKTSDDDTISIFTKRGVTVHKECKGNPILIGV